MRQWLECWRGLHCTRTSADHYHVQYQKIHGSMASPHALSCPIVRSGEQAGSRDLYFGSSKCMSKCRLLLSRSNLFVAALKTPRIIARLSNKLDFGKDYLDALRTRGTQARLAINSLVYQVPRREIAPKTIRSKYGLLIQRIPPFREIPTISSFSPATQAVNAGVIVPYKRED